MTLLPVYQSYLLRIFQRTEMGPAGSFSICLVQLEHIQTGERHMFDSLQTFYAYLNEVHTQEPDKQDVDRLEVASQRLLNR